MKKLILCLIILLLITGCKEKKKEIEKDMRTDRHLVKALYRYGGGELGGHEEIELKIINNEEVRVTFSGKADHSSKEKTKQYTFPRQAIEKLESYIETRKFCDIPDKGYETYELLDGNYSWYLLNYSDGDSISFDSLLDMDSYDSESCRKFREYLYALTQSDAIPDLEITEKDKIRVSGNGITLTFELNDSSASKDLLRQINRDYELMPYSDNEMYFNPEEKLDVFDTPLAPGGKQGTLAYYAPWNNVVIFTGDYSPASGLYLLGQLEDEAYQLKETLQEGTYRIFIYQD